MKFSIKKEIILKHLLNVQSGLSSKNLIPVLNGILFELSMEGLSLISSDNELTIKSTISPVDIDDVIEVGSIVIPGKYVIEIIKKLDNEIIEFEVHDSNKIKISTTGSVFNLNGIEASEYPKINMEETENYITLDNKEFKEIINQTSFAVSLQETRPILTGINFILNNNMLECTATDSYRLARTKVECTAHLKDDFNIVIPSKSLLDLVKLLNDTDQLTMYLTTNTVLFKFDTVIYQTRLLNGTYPNTSKLIPETYNHIIDINLHQFFTAIDRASLLTSEKEKNIVNFLLEGKEIEISSNIPEIGRVEEKIVLDKMEEEQIRFSFSSKYMLDALKAFKSETIRIYFIGENNPIIFKENDESEVLQLILPIKVY